MTLIIDVVSMDSCSYAISNIIRLCVLKSARARIEIVGGGILKDYARLC